jgi:hypothetical protein
MQCKVCVGWYGYNYQNKYKENFDKEKILVKNIIAQQILTRKRSILKKHLVYKKIFIE